MDHIYKVHHCINHLLGCALFALVHQISIVGFSHRQLTRHIAMFLVFLEVGGLFVCLFVFGLCYSKLKAQIFFFQAIVLAD